MMVTIDIDAIAKRAAEYQAYLMSLRLIKGENNNDISYPFWIAFRDLYPQAGDAVWAVLITNTIPKN